MKSLLIMILMLCSIHAFAQAPSDEQTVLRAAISAANDKIIAAEGKKKIAVDDRKALDEARAKKDANDTATIKNLESLLAIATVDSAKAAQEALIAQTTLSKITGENVHAYVAKDPWGGLGAVILILIVVAFTWVGIGFLSKALVSKEKRFNLIDALSENVQEKITLPNPEYSMDKMRLWVSDMGVKSVADLKKRLDEAEAALQSAIAANPPAQGPTPQALTDAQSKVAAAETNFQKAKQANPGVAETDPPVSDAKKALDDANEALRIAIAAAPSIPNQPAQAVVDRQAERDKAKTAFDSAVSIPVNPVVLSSLGNLFPPTIEYSGVGKLLLIYQEVERLQRDHDTKKQQLEVANSSGDKVQAKAADLAEKDAQSLLTSATEKLKTVKDSAAPDYRPSASRLIAFISAMLLFIVGLVSTCFFLYFYLVNGVAPDLSRLSAILIALGIGMAPYALNKVTNASRS